MEPSAREGTPRSDRRWAGAFRVCAGCGGRNWIGARRCRRCAALLVGVPAVARPKVAMIGRRAADQVLTPRVRMAALAALVVAAAAGAVLLHLLRTDGFEERPPAFAFSAPAPAPPPSPVAEETPDVTASLRAADRGRRLLAAGDARAALPVLASAVQGRPDDAELAHLYGTALWSSGARDHGLFQLERAVRLDPQAEGYRQDLSRALQSMGRPGAAARVLYGPAMPPPSAAGPPLAAPGGTADLGGAGTGAFKGRHEFTDEDLRRRSHAPPVPEGEP